jgi:sigma-B regulation protein RsbU (phosphoserine phosphatase)
LLDDWNEPLCVLDADGRPLLGTPDGTPRHPIEPEGQEPVGWVSGGDHAPLLAALIGHLAQKELEGKLLAQETLNKYKELTLLYELGEKIAACLDVRELAWLALDEARRLLPQGKELHAAVLLAEEGGEALSVSAGYGELFPVGARFAAVDGITRQVLASGNAEIVNDVNQDPRYRTGEGLLPGMRALLCVPLKTKDRVFGVLSVACREAVGFSAAELKVLNLLASQVAVALGRVHLINALVAQERLQESLKLSRSIQMGMLSTVFPRFDRQSPVDLYAFMEPAREVSGDFYDFFHLDEETLLIAIGDVSDKGMPAALFMVMVKTLIRAMAKQHGLPHRILEAVNPELCRDNDSAMFVTLFLATLDLKTGRLAYSFGGHNPPLLLAADGGVRMLEGDSGAALGIIEGMPFTEQVIFLKPGDGLLLYTDGISEAMDVHHEEFGEQRLCGLLVGEAGLDAQEMVDAVMAAVRDFTRGAEQSDDITVLALRMMRAGGTPFGSLESGGMGA